MLDSKRVTGWFVMPTRIWIELISLIVLLLVSVTLAAETPAPDSKQLPYRIIGAKVDEATLLGWRVFHLNCHSCHGVDAVGTDMAPNLVEKVKDLSAHQFATKVLTRYRIVLGAGEAMTEDRTAIRQAMMEEVMKYERGQRGELVMPAWESSLEVKPHVLDLYAYLRARADGVLGPGQPPEIEK